MEEVFLLNENGHPRKFTPVDDYLYLSPQEYFNNHNKINNIISSYEEYIIVVSYDFSESILLENFSSEIKGLFICLVKETPHLNLSIQLPSISKTLQYNISKKEYLEVTKNIHSDFIKGNYYLTNFTFQMKSKINSYKNISINEYPISDYGGYIPLPDRTLYSFSPENFLLIDENKLMTSPIKGTLDTSQDKEVLINSDKENAEQIMVVDLMRNDLAMVSEYNSVKVQKFKKIKEHHSLYQMYSEIISKKNHLNIFEVLMKVLPAGSITGTPKHEVCKKNTKYETNNRSFYTGIAGYYNNKKQKGFMNILIRMLEVKDNNIQIGIGSGLTVDSNFEKEYDECILKGESILNNLRG